MNRQETIDRILMLIGIAIVVTAVILALSACTTSIPDDNHIVNEPFTDGRIYKFDDGPTRCYVYVGFGISCVERRQ